MTLGSPSVVAFATPSAAGARDGLGGADIADGADGTYVPPSTLRASELAANLFALAPAEPSDEALPPPRPLHASETAPQLRPPGPGADADAGRARDDASTGRNAQLARMARTVAQPFMAALFGSQLAAGGNAASAS
jgi:hypothetical protein